MNRTNATNASNYEALDITNVIFFGLMVLNSFYLVIINYNVTRLRTDIVQKCICAPGLDAPVHVPAPPSYA